MTIYKKIVFLLATVAFALSCAVDEKPSQQGFIHLSSVSGEVPDELSRDLLGSYMVVLSCGDKVICSSPYNEFDAPVKVACDAGYTVEAYNITDEQALEGRGRLRLYGLSEPFSIAPEDHHTVSLVCKPSNAKLTVGYTSGFLAKYSDVTVRAFEPSLPERVLSFDNNATTDSAEQFAFFNIDEDPSVCVEVEAITSNGDTNIFSRTFPIIAGQWLKLNIDLDVILTLSEPVLSDIYARYAFISPLTIADIEGNVDPSSILEGIIYEISDDGGTTWSSGNQSMISGRILFDSLSHSTTYQVRARYSKYFSNIINFTTEAAQQLKNASFEEWKTEDYTPYLYTLQKYFPYSSSPYWDSNNPLTTVTGVGTSTKDNLPYKSFPMVTYINAGHTGKAAQIMTLRIGRNEAVNINYKEHTVNWGKLFLGTYGAESGGRSMESRPSALSFYYTHDPYEGDSFLVNVTIYSNGTQIAAGSRTISNSTSSWQHERVNLQYSRTDLKATSIYVEFVSGTKLNSGEPLHQSKGGLPVTHGGDKTAYVHRGSVVAIDDVELIYDNYN